MSHISRLYIEHDLSKDQACGLPEGQSKYLLRVMRLSDGATVRAFNGRDGEWRCELRVHGKSATLIPMQRTREQTQGPDLKLLFAPIKKARTDFIVEKATELGVRSIQPVMTEYTQTQRVRLDRMQSLVTEAAEQTERMDLPELAEANTLPKVLAAWDGTCPLFYCDEGADASPLSQYREQISSGRAGVLIGPEGGFSPRERKMLRDLAYVCPITLGPRILRAETAVVAALTLWQSLVGDWQKPPYLPQT
ncbi:MAG: 16S rRNA (uracil(1498)-N(3))-methyltransferase [Pseudomonadota bacterium]